MGLLSDMFQQQQNIANNPAQAIRTPQQIAYDNLLNRQSNIEQQNKNYQTFNGIMSGVGGLGKIIASSMVKDPMQQAGAMAGISEQEQRLDNLRQAYENARMAQNKDYVTQAQQQLALARDDEDKAYNRAYQEAKDRLAQQNIDRNYGLDVDKFGFAQDRAKVGDEHWDKEYNFNQNKFKTESNNKKIEETNKARQKQLETYVATARDMFNKGQIDNKTLMAIEVNPLLAEVLIPKPTWFGFSSSSKNMVLPETVTNKTKNNEVVNTNGAYKSSLGNPYTVKISGM